MTNADTTEELGEYERYLPGTTVATGVAGAEQKTRTGHRYIQITSSHVEPIFVKEETSRRECGRFGFTVVPGMAEGAHTCEGSGMLLEG